MHASADNLATRNAHRQVFRLGLALSAGGLIAAAAAMGAAAASVHHVAADAEHVTIAGLRFTYPALNAPAAVLLALAAGAALAMAVALRGFWSQRRAYRTLIDRLDVVGHLDVGGDVTVIADPRPQAFCAGYARPSIYVSERTLDLMTADELEAVIAHEKHHLDARDPLRLACSRVLSRALFFVPALRVLAERYAELAELSADAAAVDANHGQRGPLASALLAFDESSRGATGVSPERVDALLGEPACRRLPWRLIAGSLLALSTLTGLVWLLSVAASAQASLNLPILSSQPCVAITMLVPCVGCARLLFRRAARFRDGWLLPLAAIGEHRS